MKDNIPAVFIIFVVIAVTFIFGIEAGLKMKQQEAVHNGHAKYVADENGNVHFEWLNTEGGGNSERLRTEQD